MHTPGPWTVLPCVADGGGINIGPELLSVGPLATVNYNGGNSEADAQLIAAAPDLLAACLLAYVALPITKHNDEINDALKAAITKAGGRA